MTAVTRFARLELALSLTVASPFLFRGLPGNLFGVDASALRDEEGRPIIPADQVRGCLRDAFEDMAAAGAGIAAADILDLFGRQSPAEDQAGAGNEPQRGRMTVSDLTARAAARPKLIETTRIRIAEETGAVQEGMMQVIELVARFGAEIEFDGRAVVFVEAGSESRWAERLDRAMKLIASIGAVKSAGYGEVVAASTARSAAVAVTLAASTVEGPERRRYRVTFDRPVLVDAEWIAANAMRGSAVIPGAVIKGALAQALQYAGEDPAAGDYSRALAALSIGHAFPESDAGGQPGLHPLPLSLVACDGETFGDALLCPEDRGALVAGRPGMFMGDWKESWFGAAIGRLGYAETTEPPLIARTHTAIAHDGIAKDQDLFTTLARSVRRPGDGGTWKDRAWILDLDLSAVALADAAKARRLVALLEHGLDGIGKTSARASFSLLGRAPDPELREIAGKPGEYAVMLVTPACILDAGTLVGETDRGAHWRLTARAAYAAYWAQTLPGAKLESFFASQRYAGGYLARRRRAYGKERYHPFLVTEAGSIFRLSGVTGDRLALVAELCSRGLPAATVGGQEATWENCPYLRENGYGHISANHLGGGTKLVEAVTHG